MIAAFPWSYDAAVAAWEMGDGALPGAWPEVPTVRIALATARTPEGLQLRGRVGRWKARGWKGHQGARKSALDTAINRCDRKAHERRGGGIGGVAGEQGTQAIVRTGGEHAGRTAGLAETGGGDLGQSTGCEVSARAEEPEQASRRNGADKGTSRNLSATNQRIGGMGAGKAGMNESLRAALYLHLWGGRCVSASNSTPQNGPACPLDPVLAQARCVADEILDALEAIDPRDMKRATVQAAWGKLLIAIMQPETTPAELVECIKAVRALAEAGGLKRSSTKPAITSDMLARIDALMASQTEVHDVE